MKLGFSKPTRTAAEQDALFAHFGGVGFDGLQLKSSQYRDYLDDPARFRDRYAMYPGVASGLIHGGKLDDAGIAMLRRLIAFAGAVGAERIILWPDIARQGLTDDDIRASARSMATLGNEAIAAGTRLSLHHHYGQVVMHRGDFDLFFDAVPDGSVGLTVDTAHLVKSGVEDVAGLIRDFRSVIDNIHTKDYADGEWRVLGQGEIDFVPIFAAVKEIGYDGWVCADEESGSELLGAMGACYRFLRDGLSSQ